MRTKSITLFMAITFTGASGCASAFVGGGTLTKHDLAARSTRSFAVADCVDLYTKLPVAGPPATYHLVEQEGKTALFERSEDGSGSVITNSWQAKDGTHFLAWVLRSGWEFVVPDEPGAQGVRLVYPVLQKNKEDGVIRPVNAPSQKCALTPTK